MSIYLPYKDIVHWSQTCKTVKELIYDNEYFWKHAVLNQYNQKNKYNTWKKTFEQLTFAKIYISGMSCYSPNFNNYDGSFVEFKYGPKNIQMMKVSNDTMLIVSDNKIYKFENDNDDGWYNNHNPHYSDMDPIRIDCKEEINITDIDLWGLFDNNYEEVIIAIINGDLYTCGNNNKGQLGYEDSVDQLLKKVPNFHNITKASCSCWHTAFIMDKLLYTFGNNTDGELGLGHYNNVSIPTLVPNLKNVTHVVCNFTNTYVIADGYLYFMGSLIDNRIISKTINVPLMIPNLNNVTNISVGDNDGYVSVIADGKMHIINRNGSRQNQHLLDAIERFGHEHKIIDVNQSSLVSCSSWHMGFVDNNIITMYGTNTHKQMGISDDKEIVQVSPFREIFQLSCSCCYTAVLAIK
ncbi:regulator of chromosome condensation RCC1 repeat protein [Klosneuvirus KNV1]|uniref:Regulator of chromosome condensation RCC1 repeat protein n=1 Tax=Klosneuvirus KNV1 TaxID=1977640 RepID=A0A1V0SJY2_9VIRU|nr:regulator of chromosome condensation RCC1 repeat protein [Klosneuvirus KNV1]